MFMHSFRVIQRWFAGLDSANSGGLQAGWRSTALIAVLLGMSACGGGVSDEVPEGNYVPPPIEWQVAFSDEFDGDALDQAKWNITVGDGCPDLCGFGNNELQTYTPDNIQVAGGVLTLQGREEADGSYTSARIDTKGKFDFRYGRVEISARLPEGQGIWPAIWMLPSDETVYGPWPLGGEIDIMEAFNPGVNGNNSIQSTTHYGLPTPPNNGTSSRNDLGVSPSMGFHVYAMEWERDTLRFFVDGVHFQTQKASNWYSYFPADELGYYDEFGAFKQGPRDAPFDQIFHLVMNFAIGGAPVGDPDGTTVWPQDFEIDYVRVYECANSNSDTERGCGVADASVVPLQDNDGGPLQSVETAQPYLERLDLYVDGPEVIELNVGGEVATNTLQVNGYTGDGVSVTNDPMAVDPDDAENIVWHVAVSGGVANVYLESEDLTEDPILNSGFDFSGNRNVGPGGDPVGEIAFDMMVNSIDVGTSLFVKLDSGYPNLGQVVIPSSEIAVGAWKTYSVKFDMLLANPLDGGPGVDLANVANPFVFEVQNGAADVYIDNIRVTNACKVVGACGADLKTKGVPDLWVFDDTVNVATWTRGLGASDSGSGYTDYFVGTDPADKVNWSIVTASEPERGEVIQVTFNDSPAFGVFFAKSGFPVDTSAYNAGAVEFDIQVLDYGANTTGMTFKIDCLFPCTSGDKSLGVVGDGEWETVTFPVSQLTSTGLDLANVNTGIVIFPTTQAGGITFQLDNIRWVATTDAPPLAQIDLPVTFEDPGVDYSLIDFEGTGTVIVADPAGGTNRVAATTKGEGAQWYAGTVLGTGSGFANPIPFAVGETTMSVRVYSPAANIPVMLKIENADGSVFHESTVFTTVANEWETLIFDYSLEGIDPTVTFVQAIIFFDFSLDVPGDGSTYYWDDMQFGSEAPPTLEAIDLPVTFDDAGVDYNMENFGGTATALVNDPIVGAANTVAMTTKNGEIWAGTIVATLPGFEFPNPIPFAVDSTTLSVRVLSPAAGIPVNLKIENADASAFINLIVNTTVGSEWETLVFDYSTQGIDTSIEWVRAIIFFDFENPTNGASYYWDDLQLVNPPAQTKIVFDDAIDATWDVGMGGADDGSGFALYTDGTNPANKSNWAIVNADDPLRGQVIDITFNDSAAFGVWFIQSSAGVDMSAYTGGSLIFDIRVLSYGSNTSGMTMKVDCVYPCTSGDQPIGVVGDGGVWETVTIPVAQLQAGGMNPATVNTGLVIFPNYGQQLGGINFRLDNIRWEP